MKTQNMLLSQVWKLMNAGKRTLVGGCGGARVRHEHTPVYYMVEASSACLTTKSQWSLTTLGARHALPY